ncbi:ABC transporter permease [Paenibacillus solisilvae]|uniref:ABC transporter permease n=1 Tax=Paenibacillus solisilvae TaxID=2486751 RepID=A0ABW0VZ37_9BACL
MTPIIVLKRIGMAVITICLATIMTFVLLRLTPGNAIDAWARDYATQFGITLEEAYRRIAAMINYNPNEPLHEQFVRYISGLIHGNLGVSMIYQQITVNSIIANAMPWTIFVASISLVISFLIGMFLGVRMAWKRNSILEPAISLFSVITSAIPDFIFAILLLVVFAYGLNWFPVNGAYDPFVTPGFNLDFIVSVLYYAAMPILTFVITHIGGWALMMKGNAVSILGEDYIIAAKARGISESVIMNRYVLKNAMLPMITMLAITFGGMLGGATLIENVFQYPGIGYFLGEATRTRDYTVMQGIILFLSVTMVVANLIADLVYSKLDPRIKVEG